MGTRVQKYKEKEQRKKEFRHRSLILLLLLVAFIGGLSIVDQSFQGMMGNSEGKLFSYECINEVHEIQLFGNTYDIKQDKIDNTISNGKKIFLNTLDGIGKSFNKIKENLGELKDIF
ncbi:hypothetical protein [Sporosalibacterium faouarense]|uniref:hypothetical protein n=1 Tax=Sporosalibacterium faouarense TaxID=516123 RepID=UPI00192C9401|nr:hypothetical protein [Sporosalibacterium faouarense]